MNASKQRLYHRLQLAASALRKAADKRLAETAGLTTAQAAVLAVIAAGDAVTQRSVATSLRLQEPAVTGMVGRLLKLGLVERTPSDVDSRAWNLRLSEDGQAAMRSARASFSAINARIDATLSEKELQRVVDCLDRLAREFDDAAPADDER
jgi:DNA-binding MarR family transcriptional regulator